MVPPSRVDLLWAAVATACWLAGQPTVAGAAKLGEPSEDFTPLARREVLPESGVRRVPMVRKERRSVEARSAEASQLRVDEQAAGRGVMAFNQWKAGVLWPARARAHNASADTKADRTNTTNATNGTELLKWILEAKANKSNATNLSNATVPWENSSDNMYNRDNADPSQSVIVKSIEKLRSVASVKMAEAKMKKDRELLRAAKTVEMDAEVEVAEESGNVIELLNEVAADGLDKALDEGVTITTDDLATIVGGGTMMETKCKDCLEGDMKPGVPPPRSPPAGLSEAEAAKWLFYQDRERHRHPRRVTAGTPWTDGVVRFCLAPDLHPQSALAFRRAMRTVQLTVSCITFLEVPHAKGTSDSEKYDKLCAVPNGIPAVFLQSANEGCYSEVGMQHYDPWPSKDEMIPAQVANLQHPGCSLTAIAEHELLHTLGLEHEHARKDRDEFVKINWGNIEGPYDHEDQTDHRVDFKIHPEANVQQPYDVLSLMHYGRLEFSRNGLPTIETRDEPLREDMGQRIGMSSMDVELLAIAYGCQSSGTPAAKAQSPCGDAKAGRRGWRLVRHLPAGSPKWHPAIDNLDGTDSYGTEGAGAWTRPWNASFAHFLFAAGDCSRWLIATPKAVNGDHYIDEPRPAFRSSKVDRVYLPRWFNREVSPEDPWIALDEVPSGGLVYGEASYQTCPGGNMSVPMSGADVYIDTFDFAETNVTSAAEL